MNIFRNLFLLIFAFFSIGGGLCHGNSLAEIREDQPLHSEEINAAGTVYWAYRENPFQKISDFSENLFFGTVSVIPDDFGRLTFLAPGIFISDYKRDLRQILTQQIFPKHFFL